MQLNARAVQDAGTVAALVTYLGPGCQAEVQLDALRALLSLCKLSSSRQEAAALSGIVPPLCAFARQSASAEAAGDPGAMPAPCMSSPAALHKLWL